MTKTLDIRTDLPRVDDDPVCQLIGVFPTIDQVKNEPDAYHRSFIYTVGHIGPDGQPVTLWFDAASIEQRGLAMDQFFAWIVNTIANAWTAGMLDSGDTIKIPLGIPNDKGEWDHDADSFWWIGDPSDDVARFQTFQAGEDVKIIPIRWSSPLGFNDDAPE